MTVLATCRTLIGGLRYPIPAAVACGLWSLTRILYTIRYGTGEPNKVFFFPLGSHLGI
jgi:glutathione S-transferase